MRYTYGHKHNHKTRNTEIYELGIKPTVKEYKNAKGQKIGKLWADNIFRKQVDARKHLLKLFDAFGIEKTVYEDLDFEACAEIRILDTHTNIVYSAPFATWQEHSVERNFQTPQMFLSHKYMTVTELGK